MLPIVLDPAALAAGLAGEGEGLRRRLATLTAAGIYPASVAPAAGDEALRGLAVLFIAGLPQAGTRSLAARARLNRVLVNVEDTPALCDFHVPALVRRGDLLISISTAGKAPGLAKLLRKWLERRLDRSWAAHLGEIAHARTAWRAAGHSLAEVSRRTGELVRERGWLS